MNKKSHQTPTPQNNLVQLPLMGSIAIYQRVATQDMLQQSGKLSQVESLLQFARTLGYDQEQITVFSDEGTQAAAPLFEREGYKALVKAIREGTVTVLIVSDVNRLLADATEIQLNGFIHLCMEKGVFVVTPDTMYDFSNLTLIASFRAQCIRAFQVLAEAEKLMQRTNHHAQTTEG